MSNLVNLGSYGLLPASHRLFDDFDLILDGFFSDRRGSDRTLTHIPRVNIEETAGGYDIHMAAPGLSREDFKIHTDAGHLTISAEMKENTEEKCKWLTREYSYTKFSRSWKLPANISADSITARYDAGVLTVRVPTTTKKNSKVEIRVD